jgi:hypothetical protein
MNNMLIKCIFDEKICENARNCRGCGRVPNFEKQFDDNKQVIAFDIESSLEEALYTVRTRRYEELPLDSKHKKNFPSWMKENIKVQEKEYGKDRYKLPMSIDHTSLYKDRNTGIIEYVTEPYNISMKTLKTCIAECEKQGLIFKIDGMSHHLPGDTIRITIEKS